MYHMVITNVVTPTPLCALAAPYHPRCDMCLPPSLCDNCLPRSIFCSFTDPAPAFRARHDTAVTAALFDSVATATQRKYSLAWARWNTFCRLYDDTQYPALTFRDIPEQAAVDKLLAFLSFLTIDEGLSHKNASTMVTGVHHFLRSLREDLRPFDSPHLQAMRTALAKNTKFQPVKRGQKLPLTADMVRFILNTADHIDTIDQHMIAVATLTAFMCLLRASEYAHTSTDNDHALSTSAIEFVVCFPPGTTERLIPAYTVRDYPELTFAHVRTVRIAIHTAKNKKLGEDPRLLWFSAAPTPIPEDPAPINFTERLFAWTRRARLQHGDQFFSYRTPTAVTQLTYPMMLESIKSCARHFGFDPVLFAVHSPRIGGATAMQAQDVHQEVIRKFGGWKGASTCMHYQDMSTVVYDRLMQLMLAPGVFTSRDIQLGRAHPPHEPTRNAAQVRPPHTRPTL
jgi:hypothetical protein